eukprot:GFUD01003835.1.p1 GENE.GFUD01003835.1~~GFUD01003835.1.p1  ORF type:complete len:350 (-),score=90.05 GFUD01003835.1:25-1074(-)
MGSEKFCLRWNDFEHNISNAFKELRDDKDFFDVTLACEDEQIQAHKVILSACSPFFRNVLRRNPHQHPLLYLKGVNYTDLQSVLNFMYHGEVNVAQEELNSFLSVAEDLRVKGLTQNQSGGQARKGGSVPSPTKMTQDVKPAPQSSGRSFTQPQKKSHPAPSQLPTHTNRYSSQTIVEDDIQEIVPVKSEPREPAPLAPLPVAPMSTPQPMYTSQEESHSLAPADESLVYDDSYDDYGQYAEDQGEMTGEQMTMEAHDSAGYKIQDPSELLQFVRKDPSDQKFYCTLCVDTSYSHKASYNTRNHVESQHFPNMFSYPCDLCDMTFSTKNKFQLHKSRIHKNVKMQSFLT